jgi:hypothetical protein
MAKETDLLKDPVSLAQLRYKEQVNAFKDQYIPKPSARKRNNRLRAFGFNDEYITKIIKG